MVHLKSEMASSRYGPFPREVLVKIDGGVGDYDTAEKCVKLCKMAKNPMASGTFIKKTGRTQT